MAYFRSGYANGFPRAYKVHEEGCGHGDRTYESNRTYVDRNITAPEEAVRAASLINDDYPTVLCQTCSRRLDQN